MLAINHDDNFYQCQKADWFVQGTALDGPVNIRLSRY